MRIFSKLTFFLIMLAAQVAYSQSDNGDPLFYERSLQSSRDFLTDTLKNGLSLYNGIEHAGYFRGIKGSAYLDSEGLTEGRVKYDGIWFLVPMRYDLYAEKLVITHFGGFHNISLINEKIEAFVLHNRVFRAFSVAETRKADLSGLCEVLYEGDSIAVFARKRKLLNERSTSNGLEREFIVSNQYYMWVDNAYHEIKSQGDMIGLMRHKKRNVILELRKNKIKFRKNKEEALITASKIYDERIL